MPGSGAFEQSREDRPQRDPVLSRFVTSTAHVSSLGVTFLVSTYARVIGGTVPNLIRAPPPYPLVGAMKQSLNKVLHCGQLDLSGVMCFDRP